MLKPKTTSEMIYKEGHASAGITLLDVMVILFLISLLLIPLLKINEIENISRKTLRHYGDVSDLAIALTDYALENGALPLPADPSLPTTDPNVFTPIPTAPTACGNTSLGKKYNNTDNALGVLCRFRQAGNTDVNLQVYIGAVPVAALGLPVQSGLDKDGRKFLYAVTRILTNPTTFDDTKGAVVIRRPPGNTSADTVVTTAQFVVLSYGQNGVGSFLSNGTRSESTGCPTAVLVEKNNYFQCKSGASHLAGFFTAPFNGASMQYSMSLADVDEYYDDALAYKISIYGRIWTPRDTENQYFTAGRNVGIGYTNGAAGTPPEKMSLLAGNVKSSGELKAVALCNSGNTSCFRPTDVANPAGTGAPIYCGSSYALKKVRYDSSGVTAKSDCETFAKANVALTSCVNGIKEVTATGGFICASP